MPVTVGNPPVTYNAAVWGDNYKPGGTFSINLKLSGSITTMTILMGTNGGTADGKTTGGSVTMTFTSSTYKSMVPPDNGRAMVVLRYHQGYARVGPAYREKLGERRHRQPHHQWSERRPRAIQSSRWD